MLYNNFSSIDVSYIPIMQKNGNDFAYFALWKSAQPFYEKIRNYLSTNFEIIFETEIEWSNEKLHENASRLYELPIFLNSYGIKKTPGLEIKIGGNTFSLIIIKDINPDYSYSRTVSGTIEPSNLNVVKAKKLFREWIYNYSGVEYAVHSTTNRNEFFFQAPLILGTVLFKNVMKEKRPVIKKLTKDLEGANGWSSWKDLFDTLNITVNYLVLRNFENLPYSCDDADLDVLTDSYQRFASAIGAKQLINKKFKGFIFVENKNIPIDIRFIGDSYYNSSWQKDMLNSKILRNGFFVPRIDHYFFSLLFHCKVQKLEVKAHYRSRLNELAKDLKFNWYSESILNDHFKTSEIINGFFKASGYFYEDPIDSHVIRNKKVTPHLINKEEYCSKEKTYKKIIKKIMLLILPHNLYFLLNGFRRKILRKPVGLTEVTREKNIKIFSGEIVKGRGKGKKTIESLSAFLKQHNIEVFPGTLNVVLNAPVILDEKKAKFNYQNHYYFWDVKINGIDCYANRWRKCPYHIIEIVSSYKLRDLFPQEDKAIKIVIPKDIIKRMNLWNLLLWNITWRGRIKLYYKNDLYVKYVNKFERGIYLVTAHK